jgi:hypothetical protein
MSTVSDIIPVGSHLLLPTYLPTYLWAVVLWESEQAGSGQGLPALQIKEEGLDVIHAAVNQGACVCRSLQYCSTGASWLAEFLACSQ